MTSPACRVCDGPSVPFYNDRRAFYRCLSCSLVFTLEIAAPDEQERHYKSQWEIQQPDFWRGQTDALLGVAERYVAPRRVLDFGAGSGGMTLELKRRGIDCTPLEPMEHGYLKDQRYPAPFDAIFAVEVVEHILDLWAELNAMYAVLAPGGIIVLTTLLTEKFIRLPDAAEHFKEWWYKDDPTHVSFFCKSALDALAKRGGWDVDVIAEQVIVLRRTRTA